MIFEGLMDPSFRIPSVSETEIQAVMIVMVTDGYRFGRLALECWGSDSQISHVTGPGPI